jgi:hypothetical protein
VTDAYVVMLHVSGRGKDSQWFDFKPVVIGPTIRVEWDLGTMLIVVPHDTATTMIRNGHARLMTSQEKEEYTLSSKNEPTTKGE